MAYTVFDDDSDSGSVHPPQTAGQASSSKKSLQNKQHPVPSTSKVTLDSPAAAAAADHPDATTVGLGNGHTSKPAALVEGDGLAPMFVKKKEKKRDAAAAASNGPVSQLPAAKRVKTFYDDDEDAQEEDDQGHTRAERKSLIAPVNGSAVESKKQQRKKLQAERREKAEHLLNTRKQLPVWYAKEAFLKEIEARDTVVVLGETGSGKTTQIPQFLLSSNIPKVAPRIAVTQPRRVAATSLARRVAEEVGCQLGGLVGYTVRFDDCSNPNTRLKYLTDGTLLQEILGDRLLEQYDIVVIDEAHERSLRTDMILGFLKEIQRRRKEMSEKGEKSLGSGQLIGPLKIIVMSATLDAKRFSEFYDDAKVLYVKGRAHKVKVLYLEKPTQDYIEAALKCIFQIHYSSPPGDILVFLSGQDEIENLRLQLETFLPSLDERRMKLLVCPLYARLTPAEQNKAFNMPPPNTRKVILATNVAETSITISGIKYVVDTGMAKEKSYHPDTGMDSLLLRPISKSSATQRAGRAGRESAGTCYRLYTELDYRQLDQALLPEIQRCSLAFALLHLLASGQEDVFAFDFMDRPEDSAMAAALMELHGLGALNDDGKITIVGRQMASLPLEPRQAKALLASFAHGCPLEMVDLLSLLGSADSLLAVPHNQRDEAAEARSKFIHRSGDHMMLLNILRTFEDICGTMKSVKERRAWCRDHFLSLKTLNQVLDTRKQLRERIERMNLGFDWKVSCGDNIDLILQCLLEGNFVNTAMRMPDGSYRRTTGNMRIKIHPSSILQGRRVDAIVFSELVYTSAIYARTVSSIPLIWLRTKVPNFFAHNKPAIATSSSSSSAKNTAEAVSPGQSALASGLPL